MEKVQNATTAAAIREQICVIWDAVIDLQDEVATLAALTSLSNNPDSDTPPWISRPAVDVEEIAKEVLGCKDRIPATAPGAQAPSNAAANT